MRTQTLEETAQDVMDRRSSKRKAVAVRFDINLPDASRLQGHSVDLSVGGVGFVSPVHLDISKELQLTMPLMVFGEQRHLNLNGRVCYCSKVADGQFRVGLQFVGLDDASSSFIHAVCN